MKKHYVMNKHITKKLSDEQTYRKFTHKNWTVKIVPKKKTLNFIFKSDKQTYWKKLSDEQTYEKKLKCQNPDGRFSLNKRKEEPANTGLNFCYELLL